MASSYAAPANAVAANNYIGGGLIAGFIGVVVSLSLLCFCCFRRSKVHKVWIDSQNTPFSRTGGSAPLWMEESNLSPSGVHGWPSIAVPEKSITRNPRSHNFSATSFRGEPSPASSRSSLQYPTLNPSPRSRALSGLNPARSRHNRSSSGFSVYSSSPSPSRSNYRLSSVSSIPPFKPSPVRQPFIPSLSDELAVSKSGEYLIVLQSFDDGWCLVARDKPSSSRRTSFLSVRKGDNVDIGVVPAWVFAEPLKGVSVTRPFRSSSVNALRPGGNPTDVRNTGLSWSYFA